VTPNRHGSAVIEYPNELEIVTTREFDAPIELVFDVLTKPEHVRHWFARMGGDLRKEQESLRRIGLEVFGRAGALRAAKHRRRMLGPVGPGDRRPAGLGRRSSVLVVLDAAVRACRRLAIAA